MLDKLIYKPFCIRLWVVPREIYQPVQDIQRIANRQESRMSIPNNTTSVSRESVVRGIVYAWMELHPDKRLPMRTLRREIHPSPSLETLGKTLDTLRDRNPRFPDPRQYPGKQLADKDKRVRTFLAGWEPQREGQRVSKKSLRERFGISARMMKKISDKLPVKDKKKLRSTSPHSQSSIETVTRGLASLHPEDYISLGTLLKEAGLPWKPSEAFRKLRRKGFKIQVKQVQYAARRYKRYIVDANEKGRMIRFLKKVL